MQIKKSGIQSHNSLGVGERYHQALRDTYGKLKFDHPSLQRQVLLALAVKAINDTLGPEGVVLSALVFGEFPCLLSFGGPVVPRASLAKRALAAQDARRHMARHLAQGQIKRSLHHQIPQSADRTYQSGDNLLVWREKLVENRIGELTGPYTVCSYDASAHIVQVQKEPDSPHERYNVEQVRPFLQPIATANHFVVAVAATLNQFTTPSVSIPIHLTEVINKNDSRANFPEM